MHDLVRKHMTCTGNDCCHCVMDQSQVAFTVSASSTITLEKYKTATRLRRVFGRSWSSCQRSEIYLSGVRIRAWRAPVSVSELSELRRVSVPKGRAPDVIILLRIPFHGTFVRT
ncbi:hypothetical protein PISMIDRAFT_175127 [Pisolithus microcarpus 441]|uniref:Uncharacterized protein n=1 Tax=Pisolithus microcarpus 441 TaxID=765257 RepID=A0A0C9ZFP4_9AGAM|nr:hypothetical protein PISMIDRAFT_175127 [Pisolithus microcarpus 441]